MSGDLCELVANYTPSVIRPYHVVVAWNGVLTLAMRGFPVSLMKLKQQCTKMFHFSEENPGSKWPKITLAAVNDAHPPLTLDELVKLKQVCEKYETVLSECEWHIRPTVLSMVFYTRRALHDGIVCRMDMHSNNSVAREQYDEVSVSMVESVVNEVPPSTERDRLEKEYLPRVHTHAHRASHYTTDVTHGNTLVCFLDQLDLPPFLDDLQRDIDHAVGEGVFQWLPRNGLHMTLRALH